MYICNTNTGAVLQGIDCKGMIERISWNPVYDIIAIGSDADRKLPQSLGSDGLDEGFLFPQSMNRGPKTANLRLLSFSSEQK